MNLPVSPDLYTPAQIRQLEQRLLAKSGQTLFGLMQRAAQAAWAYMQARWPRRGRLVICCGPGHNGGDGLLLAAIAAAAGETVQVLLLEAESRGEAAWARQLAQERGVDIRPYIAGEALPAADLYVDALYGIGLDRPLTGAAAQWVDAINALPTPVFALDVPSGLHAATGRVAGAAIRACATLTFIAVKTGLVTGQAADHVGALQLDNLDLHWDEAATAPTARLLPVPVLAPRARSAHKGLHGHVLVVGGERGMAGAVQLAGAGALRAGAGLVSVATRAEHLSALNASWPELMAHAVDGPPALLDLLAHSDVLALGPGLGQQAWGHGLWLTGLDSGKPLVLDADGLNWLARYPAPLAAPAVLTPHPGEAARLLGVSAAEVEADRYAAVRELAQRYQAVVVLKGAGSLLASPEGELAVCPWGNPGMAAGGMGDLLTGCIAGLLAQGATPWQAACQGVAAHALAGDAAAREGGPRGMVARDLLPWLRQVLNQPEAVHG